MKLSKSITCLTLFTSLILPIGAHAQSFIFRDTFLNSQSGSVAIDGRTPTVQPTGTTTWSSAGTSVRVVGNTDTNYGSTGLLFLNTGTTGNIANFALGSSTITAGDTITLQFDVERLVRADYRNGWLGIGFTNSASDNLAAGNSGPWIRMQETGEAWLYGGAATGNALSIDSHFGGVGSFIPAASQSFTTVTFTLNTATLAYSLDNGSGNPLTGTLAPTHTPNYDVLQIRWSSAVTDMSAMRIGEVSIIPEPSTYAALLGMIALALVFLVRRRKV